jgi:hypothetical protein
VVVRWNPCGIFARSATYHFNLRSRAFLALHISSEKWGVGRKRTLGNMVQILILMSRKEEYSSVKDKSPY